VIIFLDLSNNKYIAINFRKEEKEKMKIEEKEKIEKLIRSVKDFPEKGVIFRDITTALKDKEGLEIVIKDFTDRYKDKGIDYVVGADARGFIFGAAIAYNIGAGFVPARKPGKLPAEVESVEYSLEYGKNSIEIHKDAFGKGSKILIVDDLLATGGTAKAMVQLVEKLEAEVYELAFMIELSDLGGRDFLKGYEVYSQLKY
jgi:adenine phosphoribosyltransferase